MELKYHEDGHYQSVLRSLVVFNVAPLFQSIQWIRQRYLTRSTTHAVVSREINPWVNPLLDGIQPVNVA